MFYDKKLKNCENKLINLIFKHNNEIKLQNK